MASVKSDRVDFEKLLNHVDPVQQNSVQESQVKQTSSKSSVSIDEPSTAETMEVKMFDYDFDAVRKGLRKKARKTVLGIVQHIVPENMIHDNYIQDKIEQDIETMTDLLMQSENNKIMQRTLVESVSRGNLAPRNFEVFGQLTDRIQSINKQIVDTEQKLRKTYVDLKYETKDMIAEVMESSPVPQLQNSGGGQGKLVTSTKSLIAAARERHLTNAMKAKEAKFTEK